MGEQELINEQSKQEQDARSPVEAQPISIWDRLATRLTATLVFLVIISTAGTGAWLVQTSRQTMERSIVANNLQVAERTAYQVQQFVDNVINLMTLTIQMPGMWQQPQNLRSISINERFRLFRALHAINANGQTVSSTSEAADAQWTKEIWFQQALQGRPYISSPFIRNLDRMVTFALPIWTFGETTGVLGADVSVGNLQQIAEQTQVGEQGVVFIVTNDGDWIAHSDPAQLTEGKKGPDLQSLFTADQRVSVYRDENGIEVLGVYSPVPNVGWSVVVQQPLSEAYAPAVSMTEQSFVLIALSAIIAIAVGWASTARTIRPLRELVTGAIAIGAGNLSIKVAVKSKDEFGQLAAVFNQMAGRLQELYAGLEQQVADRTQGMQRRSNYIEAAAGVGRAVTSILDMDQLIQQVVELIRARFDLYYVGLFLVDKAGEWAVLRAGTGEAGRAMLARGHQITVGEGMIGWSIAHAQARIALMAEKDIVRLATSELPDTRSEAALPLRSRGQVLGAFTVQSTLPNAFDEAGIAVLQTMADQVAVALDNARLFTESQAALETTRHAHGKLGREAWSKLLQAQSELGRRYDPQGILPTKDQLRPESKLAMQEGKTIPSTTGPSETLAAPIKVRDQVIGVLDAYKPAQGGEWTPAEIALLETLTEQLGLALDSARLYQDTQRRAAREQLTGQVTTRMRESLDIERVLQTAARELGEASGAIRVDIKLGTDNAQ